MISRKNRLLATLLSISLAATLISGCAKKGSSPVNTPNGKSAEVSNLNPTGFPIVKEPVTLTVMVGRNEVHGDFEKMDTFTEYEKLSGVKIEWIEVPVANLAEKRNLTLASDDLPDVFYKMEMPINEIAKYGSEGMFLKLNDLIDKYAPNFKKVTETYPDVKSSITMLDGNIYSLPYIMDIDSPNMAAKLFVNKEWVNKVGGKMPTTTDELFNLLMSFKGVDFNGNGKNDEVPLDAHIFNDLRAGLRGSFGLANRGSTTGFFDEDPKAPGKVRYWPADENYKELLMYLNKLYTNGLLAQEIVTQKGADFIAKAAQGSVGSFSFINNSVGGKFAGQYEGVPVALKGPKGDQLFSNMLARARNVGAFVMTSSNENPEVTMRWVDHFYSEEGAALYFMGVEGKTYKLNADGTKYEYVEEIAKNPNGLTFDQSVGQHVPWGGNGGPSIATYKVFSGAAVNPITMDAAEKLKPFAVQGWPTFLYTTEESEQVIALESQLTTYVDQMTAEFVIGKTSFEQWDTYVKTLKQMGLEDLLKIAQTARDRQAAVK